MKNPSKLLAAAAFLVCSSVQAATLCSAPGPQPDGLDVSDVQFMQNGVLQSASDCNGLFTGLAPTVNPGFDGFTELTSVAPGGSASATFDGIGLTLSAAGGFTGTWSLTASSPITLDLVAVVQTESKDAQGNIFDNFASYLFNNLLLSASGVWSVSYQITEDFPLLTAFSIYTLNSGGGGGGGGATPPPSEADEPTTLALLGLALIGLGVAHRRISVR